MEDRLFEVNNLHTWYGPVHALSGISLTVDAEEVVALLGRNGAGKTTTFKSIMNLTRAESGSIKFKGEELTKLQAHEIGKRGIGYAPEDRRIFPDLTVNENLEMATTKNFKKRIEMIYNIFPKLRTLEKRKGSQLSGGEQKFLAVARAMIDEPDLLLLDEPFEGLSPKLKKSLADRIKEIEEFGTSIFLGESNIEAALEISSRVYVLERGSIIFQGSTREFRKEEKLREIVA